jgi:hypothetical protein
MILMHVRRFWVAGVVLAAVIALLPFSFHAERHLETATRVEGSEAEVSGRSWPLVFIRRSLTAWCW